MSPREIRNTHDIAEAASKILALETGKFEYRVSWKREGQARKRRIYQTLRGAMYFIEHVLTDEPGEESDAWDEATFRRMTARFEEPPVLELRQVGSKWGVVDG